MVDFFLNILTFVPFFNFFVLWFCTHYHFRLGNLIVPEKTNHEGADVYWLTDTGNICGLGHTSLLLRDADGSWYYFYWGPLRGILPIRSRVRVLMERVPVSFLPNGMLDLKALNRTLNRNHGALYGRTYNLATQFSGDYSRSVSYAKMLKQTYVSTVSAKLPAYGVFFSNCMQVSCAVLQASNPTNENPLMWLFYGCLAKIMVPSLVAWFHGLSGTPTLSVEGTGLGLKKFVG